MVVLNSICFVRHVYVSSVRTRLNYMYLFIYQHAIITSGIWMFASKFISNFCLRVGKGAQLLEMDDSKLTDMMDWQDLYCFTDWIAIIFAGARFIWELHHET